MPRLRDRYQLGADAYDPHNNILAGAAYIRELADQFGAPDFSCRLQCRSGAAAGFPAVWPPASKTRRNAICGTAAVLGTMRRRQKDDKNRQPASMPDARSTPTGNDPTPPNQGHDPDAVIGNDQRETFVDNGSLFVPLVGARPVRKRSTA